MPVVSPRRAADLVASSGCSTAKVKIADPMPPPAEHIVAQLPDRLRDLMAHSFRLQERIRHLEGQMSGAALVRASVNPVLNQLASLEARLGFGR